MEEQDPKRKSRPGIPEALDPAIGNGAPWESDAHHFILRSTDPLQDLDEMLLDETTRQMIIKKWNNPNGEGQNEKTISSPSYHLEIEEREEIKPIKSKEKKKQKDGNKIKAEKIKDWEEEQPEERNESDTSASNGPTQVEESKEIAETHSPASVGKVGKRVKKVVKSAKKEQSGLSKSAYAGDVTIPMESQLSPYTQWLKDLRGSEYVHPYGNDYGLDQLSATSRGGVSETFADLLAAQGHTDQAREMYLRLMKKYPEKSSFFAAKIEALK